MRCTVGMPVLRFRVMTTFIVTVTTARPKSICHPAVDPMFDAKTDPTAPVWKCPKCGRTVQKIAPEHIIKEAA